MYKYGTKAWSTPDMGIQSLASPCTDLMNLDVPPINLFTMAKLIKLDIVNKYLKLARQFGVNKDNILINYESPASKYRLDWNLNEETRICRNK